VAVRLSCSPWLQWVSYYYSPALTLLFFALILGTFLAAFLAYHVYLVLASTTTNEVQLHEAAQWWCCDGMHVTPFCLPR